MPSITLAAVTNQYESEWDRDERRFRKGQGRRLPGSGPLPEPDFTLGADEVDGPRPASSAKDLERLARLLRPDRRSPRSK
jgi:hypothetical protein